MSGILCEARSGVSKLLVVLLAVLVGLGSAARAEAGGHPTLRLGDQGKPVVEAQFLLVSHGYVGVATDGKFGSKTDKAVRHFQRSNGLTVDGIVGSETWGVLDGPATASAPAVRQTPRAPAFDDPCAEMSFYRQQAGLPEQFDAIGYRESRCRNDVTSRTGCCFGWLQLYLASHLRSPGYRDGVAACGVTQVADIRGNSDAQKRAQMCVAKVLYDVSGMSPWRLG